MSESKIQIINIKGRPKFVKSFKIKDLDSSKFSNKFKSHGFDAEKMIFIKCDVKGNFLLRGKRKEYRIVKYITNE